MFLKKIYEIGKNLGLKKGDIDAILSASSAKKDIVKFISPVDLYKTEGKYGTISINDIQ